jgi:hypothetical protein
VPKIARQANAPAGAARNVFSFLTPYLLWIKLAAVAALCGAAAYGTYLVMDARIVKIKAQAETEKQEAVDREVASMKARLNVEVRLRVKYEALVGDKVSALLKSMSNIQEEQQGIAAAIAREREAHKEFYEQPLPPGGYEQWKRARALVIPVAPASAPTP